MRLGLLFAFIFSTLFIKVEAQNFVPNGGFETITNCPSVSNGGSVTLASPWFIPNGQTPDLYNICATLSALKVPQNWTGWEMPHSGNGYAGIASYNYNYSSGINGREYIEVQLVDTLTGGKNYCVEFYASRADSSFWATNRLGACLTKQALSGSFSDTISAIPQIFYDTTTIFQDTTNWIRISGTYLASGGEKYITIGNFYADNQTDTVSHLGTWYWAYFYIDDVSVLDCGWSGIDSHSLSSFSLSPNPSNGNFQLTGNFSAGTQLHIYNLLGEEVMKPMELPAGDNSVSVNIDLAEGIYSVILTRPNNDAIKQKLTVVK